MSHRTASQPARGPAAVATLVILAALCVGLAAGPTLALLAITHDPAGTVRIDILAAVIMATALDLLWMARNAAALYRLRGQS